METKTTLTLDEARALAINSQLLSKNNSAQEKTNLFQIIETLGYVQIDTMSVVERSHHHILWTRMPSYEKIMIDELLENDKTIFEYWSHAAAYLPMKDFRYTLIRKRSYSKKYKDWKKTNTKILRYVLDRIKSEGPLQSKDFEDEKNAKEGWSNRRPSKEALDFLFHEGKLMVAKRKGFQIVYDLAERVLPAGVEMSFPTEREFYFYQIFAFLRSNGFADEREIMYLRKYDRKLFNKLINELMEERSIIRINIKGMDKENYYTIPDKLELLNSKDKFKGVHILSPFDNLIIQRKRLKSIFNYDYQIECYLPQIKRKHGYFCMPVLAGDKFIGKIDAKASRENKAFIVHNFYCNYNIMLKDNVQNKLQEKLIELAKFTGCEKVVGYERRREP